MDSNAAKRIFEFNARARNVGNLLLQAANWDRMKFKQ